MSARAKILIIGGAGYIGSHVVELLLAQGMQCVVVDDLSAGHLDAVLSDIFYQGKIQDEKLIKKIFSDHPEIDSAMHFAGSIIVPESVERPIEYYQNNFVHSMRFLETAMSYGLKNLIFSSTAAVYDPKGDGLCSETDIPNPANPYGRSKLMFEWLLSDLAHLKKINYVALRYFNVVGASSSGRLGQRSKQSTHLLKVAVETACGKRQRMSIFGDDYSTPDGTCIRDFIHIEDLAWAHLKALQYLEGAGENQILNCGYGRGVSVREMITALKEETGINFPVDIVDRRPGDAPQLVAQVDKIKEAIGWNPQHQGLAAIVRSAYSFEKSLIQ